MLLDLQTAVRKEPEVNEAPEMPRRSRCHDREISMSKARSPPMKKVKSPSAKKGKSSSDTAPIEIIDHERSPELKQLLIKHMIGRVVIMKKQFIFQISIFVHNAYM